jgi:MFS family permease
VPILIAANYLLLAIMTLVAGATGDTMGRKQFLLIGLASVLLAELTSMFWLGTEGFFYANLLLNVAQVIITPMCIALAAFTFAPGVRPFAYGVIFSTQAVALGSSSSLYSMPKPVGNGTTVFFLPIMLGVIAFWLILRQVAEPRQHEAVVWHELLVNVLWASAVVQTVPIGTNIAVVRILWVMMSRGFLQSLGAWNSNELLENWQLFVASGYLPDPREKVQ